MAGIIIKPGIIADPSRPKLRVDARLTAGSLLLFDPAHSSDPIDGVPAIGATLPNIAATEAAALIGSGDATTLGLALAGANTGAGKLVMERTDKGGLHGMVAQSGLTVTVLAVLRPSDAIKTYLLAHTDHDYYMSMWMRPTRASLGTSLADNVEPPKSVFVSSSAPNTNNLGYLNRLGWWPNGTTREFVQYDPAPETVGSPTRASAGFGGWAGTPPSAISGLWGEFGFGMLAGFQSASYQNTSPSYVLYAFHLMDLTAAGITAAEADAIDAARFAAAFGTGGRYADDSGISDPATVLGA